MVEHDVESVWAVLESTPAPDKMKLNVAPIGTLADGREVLGGLDSAGDRHILFPLLPSEQFANAGAGRALQLRLVHLPGGRYASALCVDRRLDDVFGQFGRELVQSVLASGKPGRDMRVAYERWRALFSEQVGPALSKAEEIGLIAELLLLQSLLRQGGSCIAWKGPDKALHDFRAGAHHIEVKATLAREGLRVVIHGVEQLDVPLGDSLHLMIYRLEESASGASLVSLVREIESEVDDLVQFDSQLLATGFRWEHSASYETLYRVVKVVGFDVLADGFPRVVGDSFVGGELPAGTTQLTYVVDLSGPYPTPLSTSESDAIMQSLANS